MTTALLSALPQEQSGLFAALQQPVRVQHAGRHFTSGVLHGQPVVLALSGIGKVAAATTATALIERFGARRIVFTGVAGGVGDGVNVGDVVVAHSYVQHDMDVSPLFERWLVPGYASACLPCDRDLSALLSGAVSAYLQRLGRPFDSKNDSPRLHQGLMASGDRFVNCPEVSQALRTPLLAAGHDVLAVEMEGAAVAQVCVDYGLPFAAMRTISDRADATAHVDFAEFIDTVASHYADHIVRHLLQSLPH
ncbi:5'-methylthioadenosine/adenosylhomocysteine nucleosidase [Simplicispira psychrophila]|uniref:5'-methylthioadenosine/adenosylhomocysteine nucleosidase n=1 Tax=Simplicispira psychrophila TaxID=80882 RepID=UPI000488A21D|nr:5'-methylthioadenosine/adenosylhomocysteine nucleosidase [Simplicispira psychrophila]